MSYTFHRKIPLDGVRAVSREDTELYQYSFVIISTEKSFTVNLFFFWRCINIMLSEHAVIIGLC